MMQVHTSAADRVQKTLVLLSQMQRYKKEVAEFDIHLRLSRILKSNRNDALTCARMGPGSMPPLS